MLKLKLSEILNKSSAMLPLTMKLKWPLMPKEIKTIRSTNSLMDRLSLSEVKDSDAQKLYSSQCTSESKCPASMRLLTNQSWNATLTSEKICIITSSWVVEQLCSQVSQKDWANKSQVWPLQLWKSRLSLLKRESSWSGSEDLFCHLCQPSKPCG